MMTTHSDVASAQPRMTRRTFLGRMGKRIGLALAVIAIAWGGEMLIAGILWLIVHPREAALGAGVIVLIAVVGTVAAVMPPIAAGIIGAVIYPRRPRAAGVVAGIMAFGAGAIGEGLTRGTISAALGFVRITMPAPPHNQLDWVGLVLAVGLGVLWWGFWGNVGGYCVVKWRKGRASRALNTGQ
jgi:hypothetical protein